MQLRPLGDGEVDAFVALLEDAARWIHDRGIEQWRPGSMRAQREVFAAAQRRGELFVTEEAGVLTGGFSLTASPDPIWSDRPEPSALYLGKLVVARDHTGAGLGERILAGAERIARERGVGWLRLDCVASNELLARYYQRQGYYPRGVVGGLLRHDKRIVFPRGVAVSSFDAIRGPADRRATLVFVVRDAEVLLIRKKRGHGAGKINAPGGMVEAGETPLSCALREIDEEVGVRALDTTPLAELHFYDTDGGNLLGYAFRARDCEGQPRETAEAAPFWCATSRIPYQEMWDDDLLWLPYLLDGDPVSGEFLFHEEQLLAHRLRPTGAAELASRCGAR
jgi:8-oxo-dGTP diphosphatase